MTGREPERTATAAELAAERAKLDRARTGAWRHPAEVPDVDWVPEGAEADRLAVSCMHCDQPIARCTAVDPDCAFAGWHHVNAGPASRSHFCGSREGEVAEPAAQVTGRDIADAMAANEHGTDPLEGPSLADHARQLVATYDQMRPALPFRSEWVRMAAEVLRQVAEGEQP